jgi:hypothetical protein
MMQQRGQALREHFLGWQCRIRQIAVRHDGGRPSPGMRPRVLSAAGREVARVLTVLIVPKEPAESTAFFRFQLQKTQDSREAYDRGLAFLQAEYFQRPTDFSDRLTAVLPGDSPLAATLISEGTCLLEFDQFRQFYRLPCAAFELHNDDPARAATLWHNRLFNPSPPEAVHVLGFGPDWSMAEAWPGP